MTLPFGIDEFLNVFDGYNRAIWPLHVGAYALGVLTVIVAMTRLRWAARFVCASMAAMWIWIGAAYHILFFEAVNPAAVLFGILFIVQGFLFLLVGFDRKELQFRLENSLAGWLGALMILFAMVGYPLLSKQFGHVFPAGPAFGVTPCATTIFTFGLLLWSVATMPRVVLAIPLIWSAIATTAAISLGMKEDYALPVAAVLTLALYVGVRLEQRRHHLTGAPT